MLLESVQSSGDKETDLILFAATMKVAGSILTKRFPAKRKNKVRPIDDYKASLVSFAVTQRKGVAIYAPLTT